MSRHTSNVGDDDQDSDTSTIRNDFGPDLKQDSIEIQAKTVKTHIRKPTNTFKREKRQPTTPLSPAKDDPFIVSRKNAKINEIIDAPGQKSVEAQTQKDHVRAMNRLLAQVQKQVDVERNFAVPDCTLGKRSRVQFLRDEQEAVRESKRLMQNVMRCLNKYERNVSWKIETMYQDFEE